MNTEILEFIAQAISIAGMLFAMISFQCKRGSVFFALQALSGASFAVSFFMQGNSVAGVLNLFNILRGWAFGFAPEKWRRPLAVTVAALYVSATVLTFDPAVSSLWLTLLILSAQLVGTTVMYLSDPRIIRIAQVAYMSPAWMVNNVITWNIGGILCEAFNVVSSIIALIRFRREWFGRGKYDAESEKSA